MKEKLILISKDALGYFYLPTYGNTYWKTPNIDDLAKKGTIFRNHYTAAPSSAMSYYSMFTGLYPHQTKRKNYRPVENDKVLTVFDQANQRGYKTAILWDESWMSTAKRYSECYGKETLFFPLKGIKQSVGGHYIHDGNLLANEELAQETISRIYQAIYEIDQSLENYFLWVHLPHVLNGRICYGSDMDLFDQLIGELRNIYKDSEIYITSDHGNLNGMHNKIGYGFDVYESAIKVPLITPRMNGKEEILFNTSHCDLFSILFNDEIKQHEFIYSDSAYYGQLNRKLAIKYNNYKYIYNKFNHLEELYDVEWDPNETVNLLITKKYDEDRHYYAPLNELYFYPHWNEVESSMNKIKEEYNRIWKNGTFFDSVYAQYEYHGKNIWRKIKQIQKRIKLFFKK